MRIKPRGTAPDVLSGGLDNWTSVCNHTHKQAWWDSVSLWVCVCECVCVCVCAGMRSPECVKNSRIILCQREKSPVTLRALLGIFTHTKVMHYSQDIHLSP